MYNKSITLTIWGRELDLEVEHDCFEGEEITSIQKETYEEFMSNFEEIFADAHSMIKDFCMENYSAYVTDNFVNIFRYIKPKQLYIKRSVTNKRIAGILCSFKFDMEHGLAIYIENGKVSTVGTQDIIL